MTQFWRDLCSLIAAFGTVVVGISVLVAWWTYKKELRDSERQARERHYHAIDLFYFEILRLTVDFPYLRSEKFIEKWDSGGLDLNGADQDRAARYDSYAFIVWNFLETIYDRCQGAERCILSDTWQPIFAQDGLLHLAWFRRQANKMNFKDEFQKYVEHRFEIRSNLNSPLPNAIGL